MTAGSNHIVTFVRYNYDPDDVIGGAKPTGTMLHQNIEVRIKAIEPTMALLEQGLETEKLFRVKIHALDIQENDEMTVNLPINSWYYNKNFRVISTQHPSLHPSDPRHYMVLVVRRWEKHREIQH